MSPRSPVPYHPDLADRQGVFSLRGWIAGSPLGAFALQAAGLLALVLALLGAGPASAADWAKNFSALAGGNTFTMATAVDATDTYIAGYFTDTTLTLGSVTLTRIGTQDAFVAKLDADGTVLWAKNYGGSGAAAQATAIALDDTGNVYLGGYFNNASLTTPALTRIGDTDAFALKLAAGGATTWARNYGGSGALAYGNAIAADASGNVYLGGYFYSTDLTNPALTKIGTYDAFAFKLDAGGATTWARNYGGVGALAFVKGIAADSSGNVYLGGNLQGANLTTPALTKRGSTDPFAFKLDASGATTWAKNFGGAGVTANGNAIAVDGSGNVVLGGDFNGGNMTTPALTKAGTRDAFALQLDSSGTTTWAKNFGVGGATASANAIAVDSSGNVFLGGHFSSGNIIQIGDIFTPALTKIGSQDAFAFKLASATGATTWSKNYGGSGAQAKAYGIAVDVSGNVVLGGSIYNASLTTPALTKIGNYDAFAFKLASSGATTWAKSYGGLAPGNNARVNATAVDAAGNTYIAGYFDGVALQLGSVTLTRISTTQDAFAAKLDAGGTVLWAKNYGGSGAAAAANAIAVDSSGNVYLGGYFNSANLTTPALTKIGSTDAFAFKLDASGATVWAKNYSGSGASAWGAAIAVDGSGNVVLSGYFQSGDLTTPALTQIGTMDAFVFKLDAGGATTWARNYGGSGASARGFAIAVDGSGNVLLGGYFQNANLTTPALTLTGSKDAFAFKLDTSGTTVWARNYGGSGAQAFGNAIAVDSSGNVLLGGYFSSANLTTPALTLIGDQDAFAFKLDAGGATTWAKNFGGSGALAYGNAIAVDSSGNVLLGGYFDNANLTTPALTLIGYPDAFAFKLDAGGATTWAKNFGGSGALAYGNAIAVDASGNVLLGGYFNGANLTTPALTKGGNKDALLIRVAPVSAASSSTSTTPSTPTLTGGTGGITPGSGQTVTVTTSAGSGAVIRLPSQSGSSGTSGNAIKVDLPGTGTVSASSTGEGTQLVLQSVTLPGATSSVSMVSVDQGSATFTASKTGQAVAGLKNGIVVVSGSDSSQVTVDASTTRIGIKSSDTIVIPKGAQSVSGTVVDLPVPLADNSAAPVVTLKVGDRTLTVTSSQAKTTMTFQMVDVGGVSTPVLAISGAARIGSGEDNQPMVSIRGSVIHSGSSGGQKCNTVIQASSEAGMDVVHVVTCYVVLPTGTFSAMSGGNAFAALKDGIVWAGETAEFDKSGKVSGAYLGTQAGNSDAVGDDIAAGDGKFTGTGFTNSAFVPRLSGTALRLNGAKLDESLLALINQSLGGNTVAATASQSAQGLLTVQAGGALTSVFPTRRIRVDTSRADGVSVNAEGNVEVSSGGLVAIFAPSVSDPAAFAAKVAQALPGATSQLRWNGSWQITGADGVSYVGRPAWSRHAGSASTFSAVLQGNVVYNDGASSQTLAADFHDYTTLQATFAKELNEPKLTVVPGMDGTAQATVGGKAYTLVPQWQLLKPSEVTGKPAWWMESGVVYLKNADGTAQGFGVK